MKKPTVREKARLRMLARRTEEVERFEIYRNCPQKDYRILSGGRDARILIDQSGRLGIPCSGAIIDLGKVLCWLHDFLAAGAAVASEADDRKSEALERYRNANASLTELELAAKQKESVPREEVKTLCSAIGARAVRAFELLEITTASEIEIWFSDPTFRAMPTDARRKFVRDFIRAKGYAIRNAEFDALTAIINGTEMEVYACQPTQ